MTEQNHDGIVITGGKYTCGEGTKTTLFWMGSLAAYALVPSTLEARDKKR